MSLSKVIRNTVLALGLFVPAALFAQGSFSTNGAEYFIAGHLLGDQANPRASLNGSGGFLVWEDNAIDNNGLGIAALALDSNLNAVSNPFRVNQFSAGNQQRPQVALLHGGGAVFVFQGGRPSRQNIYARFLSASNTWLTGDIQVNTFTNQFRRNPAIATLANGNVIIVWGSYNQLSATSMQDIYGQIYSPLGQRIGAEFRLNQFSAFNQRTPALAALPNGGFAAVWISEQQRTQTDSSGSSVVVLQTPTNGLPSVDVYARLFGASGSAAGGEFLVNSDNLICANPSVAAGTDGSFIVAWSETAIGTTNGLDVFARPFSGAGQPLADPRRINSHIIGDQYIPEISSRGTDYLMLWTSLAQDGSGKGVFGQFLLADASASGPELAINTTVINDQMQPCVASDGAGRFLTVWTSYTGGPNSFDLTAKIYSDSAFAGGPPNPSLAYSPPASDPFHDLNPVTSSQGGSTVSLAGPSPPLLFPDPPALAPAKIDLVNLPQGVYNGLFSDTNGGTAVASSGYITVKITARGAYSGKITVGRRAYGFTGRFKTNGLTTTAIARGANSPWSLQLQLDLPAGDRMLGLLANNSSWTAAIEADHLVFNRTKNHNLKSGTYTMVVAPGTNSLFGFGFGAVKLDAGGALQWSGTLADGSKVSQATTVSKDGFWPLFAPLYNGNGLVMSWLQFTNPPDLSSAINGQLLWVKSAGAKFYPAGFAGQFDALGSRYTRPLSGHRALNFPNGHGQLVFSNGGLAAPFTNAISIDTRNRVTSAATNKLTLSFTATTGLFRGSTRNPGTGKPLPFQGALFQDGTNAVGLFLGPAQSGQVDLEPAL